MAPLLPVSSLPPVLLAPPLRLLARATDTDTDADTGFLTSRLSALPKALSAVLGVWLILVSLALLAGGARLLFIGRDLGKTRGMDQRKGWLRGGLGGVLFGSTLLGAISTLATLLVVSRVSSTPLERWGTLAVILCPALAGAVVGGRWSWAGQVACGLLGGLSLSLLLITSLHLSSLTPRLALLFVSLALCAPLSLLRLTQRYALPPFAALTGAYLLVLGMDLFLHLGFVDALGLVVASHGVSSSAGDAAETVVRWSTTGGKGLLAAWWICALVGGAWQTWWGLGTEGDDTWNAYLAQFTSAHPSARGTHLPPSSFLARLRARLSGGPAGRGAFSDLPARRVAPWEDAPSEAEDEDEEKTLAAPRPKTRASARSQRKQARESDAWDSDADTLAGLGLGMGSLRSGKSGGGKSAKPARYGALSDASSDGEDALADEGKRAGLWSAASASMDAYVPPYSPALSSPRSLDGKRPEMLARASSGALSGTTAVSSVRTARSAREKDGARVAVVPVDERDEDADEERDEDADEERDAVLPLARPSSRTIMTDAKKGTVASRVSALLGGGGRKKNPASYPGLGVELDPPTPRNAVPATPSLLRALDRVRTAQREARGSPLSPTSANEERGPAPSAEGDRSRRPSMDEWWAEVVRKSEG
ncbi:hypothetical protein JCM10450v2_005931 [Rhodotorula kratochvilovae]